MYPGNPTAYVFYFGFLVWAFYFFPLFYFFYFCIPPLWKEILPLQWSVHLIWRGRGGQGYTWGKKGKIQNKKKCHNILDTLGVFYKSFKYFINPPAPSCATALKTITWTLSQVPLVLHQTHIVGLGIIVMKGSGYCSSSFNNSGGLLDLWLVYVCSQSHP